MPPLEAIQLGNLAARCEYEAEKSGLSENQRYVLRYRASEYKALQDEITSRHEAMEKAAAQIKNLPPVADPGPLWRGTFYALCFLLPFGLIAGATAAGLIHPVTAFELAIASVFGVVGFAYFYDPKF